jgi:tRNA (cytidine/uridine-2'-O-)-methyltransferase
MTFVAGEGSIVIRPDQTEKVKRHVVLVCPEVHWNTGNIGRTCLGADAHLHLIEPLGFSLDEKEVKRAGLDYWHRVKRSVWNSFQAFMTGMRPKKEEVVLFTKNGEKSFRDMPVREARLFLVFGSETRGLPESVISCYPDALYHIPCTREIRCLNLSTAVGIALYESLRYAGPAHAWLD